MKVNESTQLWFGPWYRRSPFFAATQAAGCLGYDVYNHMLLPAGYADTETEYWQVKNHVALWDVSVERQVEISGPDALAFVNLLTPRDLTKCAVWQCKYVVLTDERGCILNDPVLARIGENQFWLAAASSDIMLWVKGVALNAGMDVEICEPDVSPLQIQGPNSRQVVQALFGDKVLDMKYYTCTVAELDDIPVVITRTGWTGEVGYEIYLRDGRRGTELWDRIMEAGRPYHIRPTAPNDIRRIEAGILNFGSDMTYDDTPYHVGLEWMVNLEQPTDFIGKEALREVKRTGVNRKLVGVEIHGEPLSGWPEEYWPVHQDESMIGELRAAVYSPGLQKNIGYAMLPLAQTAFGTRLQVETPWGMAEATVVPKPFVDPKKDIPKS